MRILHVLSDDDRRGAQVFAADLHRELLALGHESRLSALHAGDVGGVDARVLGRSRWDPRGALGLRREMQWADVSIAHGSSAVLACAIVGSRSRRRWVVRQISETSFWVDRPSRVRRVRWYCGRANGVVALSASAAADLARIVGVDPARMQVIPNGVPLGPFEDRDPGDRSAGGRESGGRVRLVAVGALVAEKGMDVAIGSIAELPGAELVVLGDGPGRDRLERLAEHRCPGRVRFLGSVPDVARHLASADAMLLASRGGDSMPAVLIEAGFAGLPAVSTDVGAIAEVVLDGVTGFVVARDDHAAFDAAVRRLVEDPALRSRLGAAAREHCRSTFEIRTVARQWADHLGSVGGAPTGGDPVHE